MHVGESLPPGLPLLPPTTLSPPPPLPSSPTSSPATSSYFRQLSSFQKQGPGSSVQSRRQQSHTEMSFSHELEFNPTHRNLDEWANIVPNFIPRVSLVFSLVCQCSKFHQALIVEPSTLRHTRASLMHLFQDQEDFQNNHFIPSW